MTIQLINYAALIAANAETRSILPRTHIHGGDSPKVTWPHIERLIKVPQQHRPSGCSINEQQQQEQQQQM